MPIKIGAFTVYNVDKGEKARPCGECNACCWVLAVNEGDFHKPANTPCEHMFDGGCRIYASRPELCQKYYCMYAIVVDKFREEDRPDKLGILISMGDIESHFSRMTGMPLLAAHEIKPGAFKSYNGERVLKKLSNHVVVACIPYSKIGTDELLIDENTIFLASNKHRHTLTKYLTLYKRAIIHKKKEREHGGLVSIGPSNPAKS